VAACPARRQPIIDSNLRHDNWARRNAVASSICAAGCSPRVRQSPYGLMLSATESAMWMQRLLKDSAQEVAPVA
jgi:hypothetical protein